MIKKKKKTICNILFFQEIKTSISYQNLTDCLFFLLQSLCDVTIKALKLQSGEGRSVVTLHLQIGCQRTNLRKDSVREYALQLCLRLIFRHSPSA